MSDAGELAGCGCSMIGAAAIGVVGLAAMLMMGDCSGCIDVAEVIHGKPSTVQVMPPPIQMMPSPVQAVPLPTFPPERPVAQGPSLDCDTAIRLVGSKGQVEWVCLDP